MQRHLVPSSARLARFVSTLNRWREPRVVRQSLAVALVGTAFAAATLLVYVTGGTKFAHPHLFYVPVLLSAFCFGVPGGLAGGLLAGLASGPWMPLDVASGIPQSTSNWLSRGAYFVMIGGLAGVLSGLFKAQIETVRRYANFDPLTGLPNRAALREDLADAIEYDPGKPLALLRLQIAGFEDINVAFGYRTADALLQAISERLVRIRPADSAVYHLYAAQFGVLCRNLDACDGAPIAQDLLIGLKEPFPVDEIPICVEGCIGLAFYPQHAAEVHALVRAASFALYDAELSGREVRSYDLGKHQVQGHAIRLLTELRSGLDCGQFKLVYQPKVSIEGGACVGVEALARWRHPTHGVVSPGQFAPIAEKTALVKPLTEWALEAALKQLSEWRDAGLDLGVAVNISVRNLEDPEFPEFLRALMTRHGIGPGKLELEITESAVMARTDEALAALQKLKESNVRIAIDDFGTGQSSLSYLKELPADVIKIDQSFVRRLDEQPKNRKIVRAAIDLAHDMDLEVAAEGVETREVYEYLRTFACDMAQGYFICCPLEGDDLPAWLRNAPACAPGQAQITAGATTRPAPVRRRPSSPAAPQGQSAK